MSWLNSKLALLTALIFSWGFAWVFLTPYCGALFHCGCTWLWAGAAEKCVGALDAACRLHNCPWCSDGRIGMLIPFICMLITQTALITALWWKYRINIFMQLLAGMFAFLFSGYLEAVIHGWIKHYPR